MFLYESDLYIFADGPKVNATKEQLEKIQKTREIAHSKLWCKSVSVIESPVNKGLAASIISGVTEIINKSLNHTLRTKFEGLIHFFLSSSLYLMLEKGL